MSQANYIIICKGRIDILLANTYMDKIGFASACATDLVKHIEVTRPGELPEEDAKKISDLQHVMMESIPTVKKSEAEAMVADMFTLLDALEDKLE